MSYRPSMLADLTVPFLGSTAEKQAQQDSTAAIVIPLFNIISATLERNNIHEADELSINIDASSLNVDPRWLKNATIRFWMADGPVQRTAENLRFTGICTTATRHLGDGGWTVDLVMRDWTQMFLEQKPFASDGIPKFSMTYREAWCLICDHCGYWSIDEKKIVSNVTQLRNSLVGLGGVDLDSPIGKGVPDRIRTFGRVGIKHDDSAWDVWRHVCEMNGLITYVLNDNIYVTTSTEHWSSANAPEFVYGINIVDSDEKVDPSKSQKGIGLVSYDALSGKTIEAYYPEPGDVRVNEKRAVAKNPGAVQADQYMVLEYNGISDPSVLRSIAVLAYEETSRQELTGHVKTVEMAVDGYDLLNLSAGECVKVTVSPDCMELLENIKDKGLQLQALVDAGFPVSVAALTVRNLDSLAALNSVMHTTRVVTHLSEEDFYVEIYYQNRITPVTGDGK